ncbi:hemerythrin domain-containing protein [Maribellus sp. CM-23]|uniref:hemerythrin domain-containing protein n=1 Tax=Maribellus sp. CM-23 TaxID=2781026 RepID=UPI001F40C32D|nr:hemerythrin domain-containing protein [Maribellus sp. CM-23]MCE4566953.1 hemerythrin domain-containing protein [Maribellus sp. CM-23]
MKNITNVLSQEHQNILKVIDQVLEECNSLQKDKSVNPDFFREVIYFIKNYADGYHHKKEEDILFKAMLGEADNMHCNPIPVMLYEHDEGRNYVRGMENALAGNDVSQLIENAEAYCYLLQEHIYKEDNVLYPMAEEALNESQKEQVGQLYAAVKQSDFFAPEIEEFIQNLKEHSAYDHQD